MLPPVPLNARKKLSLNTVVSQPVVGPSTESITNGVRVTVRAAYLPDQSDPESHRFVFSYRIRIVNETNPPRRMQLRARAWTIIDADGDRKQVHGEGVVGQQPVLDHGQSFEYSSFCPLETSWGTMEGMYTFETAEGEKLEVATGRFYLIGPSPAPGTDASSKAAGRKSTRRNG